MSCHVNIENAKMKHRLLLKIVIDLSVLVTVVVAICLVKYVATPFHRGFFCHDQSIRYPYVSGTISSAILYTGTFGLPIVAIFFGETVRLFKYIQQQKYEIRVTMPSLKVGDESFNRFLCRLYVVLGHFILEGCFVILITQFMKVSTGKLRPHFIDVCKPDWSKVTCVSANNGTFFNNHYIIDDFCTTSDLHTLRSARCSFPSGHSSAAFYSMVFLVLYIETRVEARWLFAHSIKPLLQFICLTLATLTAVSRISDYEHHGSDVLVGSLIGASIACFTAKYAANLWYLDSVDQPFHGEYTEIY